MIVALQSVSPKAAGLWEVPQLHSGWGKDSRQERKEVASEWCGFLQSHILTEAVRPVLLPEVSPPQPRRAV